MPEIRQNIATGEWVIIAPERAGRPADFAALGRAPRRTLPEYVATCPFCPGNEAQTPPEVLRLPQDEVWQVRVVPNKFAALQQEDLHQIHVDGTYPTRAAEGWHEVVIESRWHNAATTRQTAEQIARTLTALQMRGAEMVRDSRVEQVFYLKNQGPGGGTSREHPHWQIIALPLVPTRVQGRVAVARRHFEETGACTLCQMWLAEAATGERVVTESEGFLAFVPYAAFAPFHIWIVPKQHRVSFREADPDELADLGTVLRSVLRRVYIGLQDPDYNIVVQSSPVNVSLDNGLHWYMTVTPRLIPWGGFELASGMFINPASPEEDAQFLRGVLD